MITATKMSWLGHEVRFIQTKFSTSIEKITCV